MWRRGRTRCKGEGVRQKTFWLKVALGVCSLHGGAYGFWSFEELGSLLFGRVEMVRRNEWPRFDEKKGMENNNSLHFLKFVVQSKV